MRCRRALLFTLTLGLASTMLAACGGDSEESGGGGSTGTGAATGAPLKIGLALPVTGTLTPNGKGNQQGFEFYWEQQGNKAGNRPVSIVFADTEGKPDVAVAKVQQFIERDQVGVTAGLVSSAEALAVRDLVVRTQLPLVVTQAATSKLTNEQNKSELVSRVIGTFEDSMSFLADHAVTKDSRKRIVFMGSDYEAGKDAESAVKKAAEGKGASVVKSIFAPLGTQDFAPFLGNVPADADAVVVFFGGNDAVRFVQQYKDFGLAGKTPLYGHWALTVDPLLAQMTDAAVGITTVQEYNATLDNPANKAFIQAWTAKFGSPPNAWNEQGYVAAMAIGKALEANPSASKTELGKAIQSVKLDAPRGPVSFAANGQVVQTLYIARVERGASGLVNKAS
jgi:branched-chain amino acid transport system substrate-binding protein